MDLSIMYLTCNLYAELWLPYLKLVKKYIEFSIDIYLCTDIDINPDLLKEIKKYNINILIYGDSSDMSSGGNLYKRITYYLNNINNNNIFVQVDDMLPRAIINKKSINEIVDILNENDNIKLIKLSNASERYTGSIVKYKNKNFQMANTLKPDSYIFNVQPFCIKKNFFIDFLSFCEFNYKKYNITHLNGGLEILGGYYFKNNNPKFIALRSHENICSFYGEPFGVLKAGVIYNNSDKILKEKENIDLKLYSKKTIFEVNDDELNRFGDHNKNTLLKQIK